MKVSNVTSAMTGLNIQKNEKVKYRIWTSPNSNSGVVIYAYDFGEQLEDAQVKQVAEKISKENNIAVLVIEYSGTEMKRSDDLLIKLQERIPQFLDNIKEYTSDSIRELIENGRYQDAINELFYALPVQYPVNIDTIIPLYGGPELYCDYGLAPALDIISTIEDVAKEYPDIDWNDSIGFGSGYGGYLIDLCERLSPGLFSMILNTRGYVAPTSKELFCNMTEWENGFHRKTQINKIGKLPIHLVDFQGWTSNPSHNFHFKPQHFDIRNLANEFIIKTSAADKNTLRIMLDFSNSDKVYLERKKEYVSMLVNQGFNISHVIIDEKDASISYLVQKDSSTVMDYAKFFKYYYEKFSSRNIKLRKRFNLLWFPVNGGAYIFYHSNSNMMYRYLTELDFDKDENRDIFAMIMTNEDKDLIIDSIINPIISKSKEYEDLMINK
jgi:hypothetical protein